jgi:hypothetical protein
MDLRIVATVTILLIAGCTSRSNLPAKFPSPSGQETLLADVEKGIVGFEIVDANGEVIYEASTEASHRMRWDFAWEDENTIQFSSSDIGGHWYVRGEDGQWRKR